MLNLVANDPDFTENMRALRRMKILATSLLVASFLVLIVARALQPRYPVMGFVAAFAEASTIGGIADWYAVVALFRRPLGLPIPHTAIIPENKDRIAEKLGSFIETQFLNDSTVAAKLGEIDFSAYVAHWLSARSRAKNLAAFILRMTPGFLTAVEKSSLRVFLTQRVAEQLETINVAPLAAGALGSFVENGRHQKLLDEILEAVRKLLNKPASIEALRARIREEMPALLNLYRLDRLLLNRIVSSTGSFVTEVIDNPDHPFRGQYDRFVKSFIEAMGTSPDYIAKIESLKREILERPEVADLALGLWEHLRAFIAAQAANPDSPLQKDIEDVLVEIGRRFEQDPQLRQEFNQSMNRMVSGFVAERKGGFAQFISGQMKSWDIHQLVYIIEANVGKDLQYIRFNGSLIGGFVGLILYTIELLTRL